MERKSSAAQPELPAVQRALVLDPATGVRLVKDWPMPQVGNDDCLIKIHLAGICATDLALVDGYKGLKSKQVLGHEFIGTVVRMGPAAFSANSELLNKRVVGEININGCHGCDGNAGGIDSTQCFACRSGKSTLKRSHCQNRRVLGIFNHHGCFAEYITLPVENVLIVPLGLSDIQAVLTEPLAAAFRVVEQIETCSGLEGPLNNVLVIGDGKLGLLLVQALSTIIKEKGNRLALLCKHPEKAQVAKNTVVGLECFLVPPTKDAWDVVVDATGSLTGASLAVKLVRSCGTVFVKSTCAPPSSGNEFNGLSVEQLNDVVVREICIKGSRCGPFKRALQNMADKSVHVEAILADIFPLDSGEEALKKAKGSLKIMLRP